MGTTVESDRRSIRRLRLAALSAIALASTLAVVPSANSLPGGTTVTGIMTSDTTWTLAGSPYVVTGSGISVRGGATLTVEPGVVVKFAPGDSFVNSVGIRVLEGRFVASGTASDPIVFTSLRDDSVGGDTDGLNLAPAAGDWATIMIDAPDESSAAATMPSVIENTLIRYGGSAGSTSCPAGAAVEVGPLGKLRVAQTDITYSMSAGVAAATQTEGVGSLDVSNVGVRESGCGFYARAGVFTNNEVDETVERSFWSPDPTDVTMTGNWLVSIGDVRGSVPPTLDNFYFRNNAIPNGLNALPVSKMPTDLTNNWWGPNVTVLETCHTNLEPTHIPYTFNRASKRGDPCYPASIHDHYYTDVLPFSSQPPVPPTGPGAAQ